MFTKIRAVINSWGAGISPGYYECGPRLLLLKNKRKIEPKEIPCCLIPRLLVVFTRQLEILVTTLSKACTFLLPHLDSTSVSKCHQHNRHQKCRVPVCRNIQIEKENVKQQIAKRSL